jgi:hypothetical protein
MYTRCYRNKLYGSNHVSIYINGKTIALPNKDMVEKENELV